MTVKYVVGLVTDMQSETGRFSASSIPLARINTG